MIGHILIAVLLTWLALLAILYAAVYALGIGTWLTGASVPQMKASWVYRGLVFVADILIMPIAALFMVCVRAGCYIALAIVSMRIRHLETKTGRADRWRTH